MSVLSLFIQSAVKAVNILQKPHGLGPGCSKNR